MSTEQRHNSGAVLRQSDFPPGSNASERRRRELAPAQPLPAGVTATAPGGVPAAEITAGKTRPRHVVPG